MAAYGDALVLTRERRLAWQVVRERAYKLWKQDGRPGGRSKEYWHRTLDQHLRERALYCRSRKGVREVRADEYWRRVCDFEAY